MNDVQKTAPILTSRREVSMPIGEKIQALRTMKGWSQEDLAKKLHTKAPNISRLENNKVSPSGETLKQLGQIFEVSIDYLLFDTVPLRPLVGYHDSELVEQFTLVDNLDDTARTALKRIIKALTAEQKMRELAGHGA